MRELAGRTAFVTGGAGGIDNISLDNWRWVLDGDGQGDLLI
jgi:hypothetical protein